jgi:GNAT superfamily N-acetyltransferase
MEIVEVESESQLEQTRLLFRDYFTFLAQDHGLDISYQGIENELAALPGEYAPPNGRLILALESGEPAGCAALRALNSGDCELKRMYVLPRFRGRGVGRALAGWLIGEARSAGYRRILLDTASVLHSAISLYESLGFTRTPPYYDVPAELRRVVVFMERSV